MNPEADESASEMERKIQEGIDGLRREIEQQEKDIRDDVLREAGLCEVRKGTYGSMRVPYPVSDEQYAQVVELLEKKRRLDRKSGQREGARAQRPDAQPEELPFQIEMVPRSDSKSATLFALLAWILWIGGAIFAVMSSFTLDIKGDSHFSIALFLGTALTYAFYGGLAAFASELAENISAIRFALSSIRFKKR